MPAHTHRFATQKERLRIIELAQERFLHDGFYKTSMDELARELQMSKKTIYKYFPSKEELVEATVRHLMGFIEQQFASTVDTQAGAFARAKAMMEVMGSLSLKVGEKAISDLQKHLPHIWTEIERFRTRMIQTNFVKIIEMGKKEGFIKNYPTEILLTLYLSSVRAVVNPSFIMNNKFSFRDVIHTTFEILLNGMLTEKGKVLFEQEFHKPSK